MDVTFSSILLSNYSYNYQQVLHYFYEIVFFGIFYEIVISLHIFYLYGYHDIDVQQKMHHYQFFNLFNIDLFVRNH